MQPDPNRVGIELTWANAKDMYVMVAMSRPLHALLHAFDPNLIGPATGPYSTTVVSQAFARFVLVNRHQLVPAAYPGMFIASAIPEIRLIFNTDMFPFNEMARRLRLNMILLDIQLPPQGGAVVPQPPPPGGAPGPPPPPPGGAAAPIIH